MLPFGAVDSSKPDDEAEVVGSKKLMWVAVVLLYIFVFPPFERSLIFYGHLDYARSGRDLLAG